MSRYKRRIIFASVTIHVVALTALFMYWLLSPDLDIPEKNKKPAPDYQLAEGEGQEEVNSSKDEIPDTGKKPTEDYEDGDLKDAAVRKMVLDSGKGLTTEEKAKKLTEGFKSLSRTPIREVDKATTVVTKAFGAEKESKAPKRERFSKENPTGQIDIATLRLYDFEVVDGKYALIYKDKNNVYIKNDPVPLDQIDPSERLRINLIKKAKQNKKARILLDATENLINVLSPPPKEENNDEVKE